MVKLEVSTVILVVFAISNIVIFVGQQQQQQWGAILVKNSSGSSGSAAGDGNDLDSTTGDGYSSTYYAAIGANNKNHKHHIEKEKNNNLREPPSHQGGKHKQQRHRERQRQSRRRRRSLLRQQRQGQRPHTANGVVVPGSSESTAPNEDDNKDVPQLPSIYSNTRNHNSGGSASFDVCFVSSGFWPSVAMADTLPNVKHLARSNPTFGFFFFTNLQDMPSPGWTKILRQDLPYRRYVTHARWGKWMGWEDAHLKPCRVIFWMDVYLMPNFSTSSSSSSGATGSDGSAYRAMAADILKSEVGLMAYRHEQKHALEGGVMGEFRMILKKRKDIPSNVNASIAWLRAQPGFNDTQCCTVYRTSAFGYDPSNAGFRRVAREFWRRFSLEADSWRDQPLWSFTLYKLRVEPLEFPEPFRKLFPPDKLRHSKFHKYNTTSDNDAAAAAAHASAAFNVDEGSSNPSISV